MGHDAKFFRILTQRNVLVSISGCVCIGFSPIEQYKNRKFLVLYNTIKMEYLEYLGSCNRIWCSVVNVREERECI